MGNITTGKTASSTPSKITQPSPNGEGWREGLYQASLHKAARLRPVRIFSVLRHQDIAKLGNLPDKSKYLRKNLNKKTRTKTKIKARAMR